MLTFHPLRVAEIRPEAEDAVGISLEVPEELREPYRGLPGQHIVVKTEINDEDGRRTYSVVSAPGESPLRIVVRVHPEGRMSRYLAEQLNVGDFLDVLPPNGSFTPRRIGQGGGVYVAFAAGCGVTPVLAIVRWLLAANEDNRMLLFYGNTTSSRAMCVEELLALKDRYLARLSLHFIMSREPQEVALYNGRIDPDRVRQFARTMFVPAEVTEYFVCGPGNMIDEVTSTLRALGVGADRIHGEHFTVATTTPGERTPVVSEVSGAPARPGAAVPPRAAGVSGGEGGAPNAGGAAGEVRGAGAGREGRVSGGVGGAPDAGGAAEARGAGAAEATEGEAEVTVLMDGRRRTFTMRMNDEVILDAAARAGLELPFSCRAGVCSTCRTKVTRGAVEMEQNYALEEWEIEQGYVLACQSRVTTRELELDYDEK
jgi:ring-1,2-phenylacetyl-CoA epoxidase subunit PaaE